MMKINESTYPLENGKLGKVAVFIYHGSGDPQPNLRYAVRKYVGDKGHGPTIRQIMDDCYVSSTSVVEYHLRKLEEQGRIERPKNKNGRALARLMKVRS